MVYWQVTRKRWSHYGEDCLRVRGWEQADWGRGLRDPRSEAEHELAADLAGPADQLGFGRLLQGEGVLDLDLDRS
ncbi:hypothetical protein GCM10010253_11590 [Streptomyces badius]|uniref:DUF397 domain-containing protein n=1 Tax=Streptomyces badius TaxID=1941 RepID=A0ABQ2SSX7_STRBA|nr:hypothetical protein GCM10010253_11590 [Streptomyces badius]